MTRQKSLGKKCHQSYEEKYMEVKGDIDENLRWYEPFVAIGYDELINYPDIDESCCQDESNESDLNMVNLDLIDSNVISNQDSNHIAVPSATVESQLLPPEQFCSMCSQLNDAQKHFFSFIITYIMKCKIAFKNNEEEPDPFYVHWTGGTGVGKSFFN